MRPPHGTTLFSCYFAKFIIYSLIKKLIQIVFFSLDAKKYATNKQGRGLSPCYFLIGAPNLGWRLG